MHTNQINSILKKNNLEFIVFVNTRVITKIFYRINDLSDFLDSQVSLWNANTRSFPFKDLVLDGFRAFQSEIQGLHDDENTDLDKLARFARSIAQNSYASPLQLFEDSSWEILARSNSVPSDWIKIVLQKIAHPDQIDIFGYDRRVIDLYFSVLAKLSGGEIAKTTELERSLEWNHDFRTGLVEFLEEKRNDYSRWEDEKENLHKKHLDSIAQESVELLGKHDEALRQIEKTYEEKVRIAEPAKLWEKKQIDYRNQGWLWSGISVLLGLLICAIGFFFFLFFPDVFSNTPSGGIDYTGSLKWLVLVGVGLGALIFLLRQAVKLSISGFHMSRDAEEKSALTSFYLSLISNKSLDPEKEIEIRTIIMNALFARVDTGLLKGENGPTMPGGGLSDIAKLVGGKT